MLSLSLRKGDTKTGGWLDRLRDVRNVLSSSKPYDVAYRENSEIDKLYLQNRVRQSRTADDVPKTKTGRRANMHEELVHIGTV